LGVPLHVKVVKDAERCLGGNGCKNSKHTVFHVFFSCEFSAIMISSANSGLAVLIKNELDPLPSRFLALDDGSSSFPNLVCGKLSLSVLVLPFKLIVRVLVL
jgi:hypothetical protein